MRKTIKIGSHLIGEGKPVFIIAEAGVNHNGDLGLAKKLVDRAKSAGADAVKFQTFKADELVTRQAPQAGYQKKNSQASSQYDMLKGLELSGTEFRALFEYCRKKQIMFLSTPFDRESAAFLSQLGVPVFKISSGDMTNTPLLSEIAGYGRPIILSTGMSDLKEIKEAVKALHSAGNDKLILLHCTSNYPADYCELNLRAISTLRDKLKVLVGYSDHSPGNEAATAAVALGACVIEKHFTLDRTMRGPDHKASLEPAGLADFIKTIRHTECALGSVRKKPTRAEMTMRRFARKSVIAAHDIPRGARLTNDILAVKRPGLGLAPKYLHLLIGKKAKFDLKKGQALTWQKVDE